jgi:hypothetical protein
VSTGKLRRRRARQQREEEGKDDREGRRKVKKGDKKKRINTNILCHPHSLPPPYTTALHVHAHLPRHTSSPCISASNPSSDCSSHIFPESEKKKKKKVVYNTVT